MEIRFNGKVLSSFGIQQCDCHKTTLNFLTPIATFGAQEFDLWTEKNYTWSIEAPTKILVRKYANGTFTTFTLQIFGFGFGFARQSGY